MFEKYSVMSNDQGEWNVVHFEEDNDWQWIPVGVCRLVLLASVLILIFFKARFIVRLADIAKCSRRLCSLM